VRSPPRTYTNKAVIPHPSRWVLGGVLGHQVGGGRGKDVATVVGAVGGGLAGNEVEKHYRSTTRYQLQIRMDDGSTRTVMQNAQMMVGQKVTGANGQASPAQKASTRLTSAASRQISVRPRTDSHRHPLRRAGIY
jgi:outer membrane lipoprotein SlyB